jgi:cephalosporin-C deacetylase-like acetyl esterase
MQVDWTQISVIGISAGANLGAVAFMVKHYTDKVDKQGEITPKLEQSICTIDKAIESITRSVDELYTSRNKHDQELTAISTLHEFRGCKRRSGDDRP